MAKGISIHIGLNRVNPAHYNGWSGRLNAAESDARSMFRLARDKNFEARLFLVDGATSSAMMANSVNVKKAIREAARELKAGDIALLTYAGHGSQVPDRNRDEEDRKDESWLLYDRQLIDDELFSMLGDFKEGVRVLVISDSCHSGTVIRLAEYDVLLSRGSKYRAFVEDVFADPAPAVVEEPEGEPPAPAQSDDNSINVRTPPYEVRVNTYQENRALYDDIQSKNRAGDRANIDASVLLIPACQDDQLALESSANKHGYFTLALLKVWANGAFEGNYEEFTNRIARLTPVTQVPKLFAAGVPNPDFEREKPFTI